MKIQTQFQNIQTIQVTDKQIADAKNLLFPNGEYVLPRTNEILALGQDVISYMGNRLGIYCFPTLELVMWLKEFIGDQSAVEIGSGVGLLGKALGIRCTDNMCQNKPDVKQMYAMAMQPTIKYGPHVIERDANWVASKWKPDIILGSWITHKYNGRTGNVYGPDERELLKHCKQYIMLGHERIHGDKDIHDLNPRLLRHVFGYVTRSMEPEKNAIFIWKGNRHD